MRCPAGVARIVERGHVSAFAFFGGIPQSILYDNTKIAVARILRGSHARVRTRNGSQSCNRITCLMTSSVCHRARGNDKGDVEGMVGYTRRNFMVPRAAL